MVQVSLDGRLVTLDGHCCDENPENPFNSEKVKVILWKEETLSDAPHTLLITNAEDGKVLEIDAILCVAVIFGFFYSDTQLSSPSIRPHPVPEVYDPTKLRRVLYPFLFLIFFGAVVWLCLWISGKRTARQRQYKALSTRDDDGAREPSGMGTGAKRIQMTSLRSNGPILGR